MTPNEVTYATLNNGHCKAGKVVVYLSLVDHMKENGSDHAKYSYLQSFDEWISQGKWLDTNKEVERVYHEIDHVY